ILLSLFGEPRHALAVPGGLRASRSRNPARPAHSLPPGGLAARWPLVGPVDRGLGDSYDCVVVALPRPLGGAWCPGSSRVCCPGSAPRVVRRSLVRRQAIHRSSAPFFCGSRPRRRFSHHRDPHRPELSIFLNTTSAF